MCSTGREKGKGEADDRQEIGRWGLLLMEHGLNSYGTALFTRELGLTPGEAQGLCEGSYREFGRRDVHSYISE